MPLPFLLRRSRGFSSEPAGSADLWLSAPETAQPTAGVLALPHCPTGSRKAEGAFPSEPAGGTDLRLSVPETAQPIAGALWGRRRFRITLPEMGAVS